jgi:nucleotide-binding universal stress UspA family protein
MLKLLLYIDAKHGDRVVDFIAPIAREEQVQLSLLTAGPSPDEGAARARRADERIGVAGTRYIHIPGAGDDALLAEARAGDYDLAVFGPLDERWSRWLPMSRKPLSAQLAISSLLVRGAAESIERVLLCTGGDKTVIEDARLAARLARRVGASATILHVLSQVPLLFGARAARDRVTEAFAATGSPELANMEAALEVLRAGGVAGEIKVRIGLVIEQIVAEVVQGSYDLLVVGAHRSQSVVERLLLEDVTRDLLGQSPIPILVVKAIQT